MQRSDVGVDGAIDIAELLPAQACEVRRYRRTWRAEPSRLEEVRQRRPVVRLLDFQLAVFDVRLRIGRIQSNVLRQIVCGLIVVTSNRARLGETFEDGMQVLVSEQVFLRSTATNLPSRCLGERHLGLDTRVV